MRAECNSEPVGTLRAKHPCLHSVPPSSHRSILTAILSCHMYSVNSDSEGHLWSYSWLTQGSPLAAANNRGPGASPQGANRAHSSSLPSLVYPFPPSFPFHLGSVLRRGEDGDFPNHGYYFVSIFGPPGCHAFNFKAPLDPVFSWLLGNRSS